MGARNPEVDAYIAEAPDFARPILERLREAFHAGCPDIEERIKWGVPSFEYRGMLGGMVAFKKNVGFGFWKARLIEDFVRTMGAAGKSSVMTAKVATVKELPPKKTLVAWVKEAKRLNDEGIAEPKRAAREAKPALRTPKELADALAKAPKAKAFFATLPPSAKRDYVEWIVEAKREDTRAKRVATAVEWLGQGKRRNWKYERPVKR